MKKLLQFNDLYCEAINFCNDMSGINHNALLGTTDGKAVGTYVENNFKQYIAQKYHFTIGSSAKGIDFPDEHINTDIKVTSITQPQSSCPFKSARQKIYGLGYNLLLFVYSKIDTAQTCTMRFTQVALIKKECTADYITTRCIKDMLSHGANKEDIIGFLRDRNIPGDEITYNSLAEEILCNEPAQGYLTISNALQWRIQYSRVLELRNSIDGVCNYEW